MATLKFEVGKVYITMADKFGDGEQTGKSVVIERTAGTVTFKHLASGEIFVREVEVFDAVQVEGCDGLDAMDNFIADNFGEEITTADIELVEQVAEVETAEGTIESVESAVETTDSTAEPEQAKVEVCKAYDAKDIIAACWAVEWRKVISKSKLDFFQGRLEKISNGQRDFLKDTQRQAVEIFGKEIPPEVYNAVNPYKPFMRWLGSKVNPVIEYDDGAKLEIRVNYFGSYSFEEITSDKSAKIEKVIYDKFHKIFGYKEAIISLEGDIAKMEKLNELYAEEYEMRLANGYPADGMELLTAENDEVIGKRKTKIAEYQQKLEVEKAQLERLKNKLAALKVSKVAA